jgi:hypothetical protein
MTEPPKTIWVIVDSAGIVPALICESRETEFVSYNLLTVARNAIRKAEGTSDA